MRYALELCIDIGSVLSLLDRFWEDSRAVAMDLWSWTSTIKHPRKVSHVPNNLSPLLRTLVESGVPHIEVL